MRSKRPARTTTFVPLLVGALCAACAATEPPAESTAPGGPPGWFSYDRPAAYHVTAERVSVPANGSTLACDLTRPAADGRFPALMYDFTPYHDPTDQAQTDSTEKYFAEHGYAVLQCDIPGTGSSPGPRYDLNNDAEIPAGHDAVEWLAAQDWSTGKVGITGTSYGGWMSLRVAATHPNGLAAVLTHVAPSNLYQQFVYPGGAFAEADLSWAQGPTPPEQPAYASRQIETWREHPLFDDYWRHLDLEPSWDSIEYPTLTFGGWYDVFRAGEVANYQGLSTTSESADDYLVMGPWTHGSADEAKIDPVPIGAQLAWWDHWLGDGSGALPSAPITSFAAPTDVNATWQTYQSLPEGAAQRSLETGGGLASAPGVAGVEGYDVDAAAGPATTCLVECHTPEDPASDNRDQITGRTLFTGEPEPADVHLLGAPTAELRLRLDLAATGPVVVKILDVAPDGSSREAAAGWMSVDHLPGHTATRPPSADPVRPVTIRLQPTDWIVRSGHRIRIAVSSGDAPKLAPTASPGRVEVLTGSGGSTVSLPISR